jgi:RimJ/RimL family protein N-acetyltransferase
MHHQADSAWSTARLKLRRARLDDAPDVLAYASDPAVTRFADWPALTHLGQVTDVIQGWQRDWESGTEFTWVVTECHADRAIGAVSCSRTASEVTFGYVLHRTVWGRGYATELAVGLVDRLFAEPEVLLIRATCDEENLASRRVLEKSGLSLLGRAPRHMVRPQISPVPRPACLYERHRSAE